MGRLLSKGMMAREENEFPLTKEAYEHLRTKADSKIISKTRYFIPLAPHTIELDVFHGDMEPLIMAEVVWPFLWHWRRPKRAAP